MNIPRIDELDLVFTYARSADNRSTNLLFTSLSGRTDIFQSETIQDIVASSLYQQIMGMNSIVFPYESSPYPVLLATTEFLEQVANRMECAKQGEAVIVCREGEPLVNIDLHETYYACQLPQKLILGCSECINNPSLSKGCAVRQASSKALAVDFIGKDPEELVEILKSRQSQIGPFVYISPVLTAHKHFAKTIRTIEEHDFSFVEDRAATRERIIETRIRLNAVKKHICSHCCIQEKCHSEFDSGRLRHRIWNCRGRYPENEETLVNNIVKKYPPKMTLKQMACLFANSGELNKRFNKCISYATFTQSSWDGELSFGIVSRRGTRSTHICKTYDEAIGILQEHNGYLTEAAEPMTPKQYALLLEAVRHRSSPGSRTYWRMTCYDRLFISPTYREGVEIHYTFNSHAKRELPWTLVVHDFGIFVQNFYDLCTQNRLPYDDTDLKPKRDRKSGKLP